MTKRELNKKLKSKTLEIRNGIHVKDGVIRVLRARNQKVLWGNDCTEVDIKIYAKIESTLGNYENLNHYGPRAIRKFLRRDDSKVKSTVSNWIKLWGLQKDVRINSIQLLSKKSEV
tara:strand:- start:14 stop:361 length:348 start_codon:yes stop_codon:yes gene_type:complete